MRRLVKLDEPDVLAREGARWTVEYATAEGAKPSPWRHADVVDTLKLETHGKCAYCESKVENISYLHVEHIEPKSVAPERVVDWINLTLACGRCNLNKGVSLGLINPYETDPGEHLVIIGPLVEGSLHSELGRRTVDIIDLRRPALFLQRLEGIEALHALLVRWAGATDLDVRAAMERIIRRQLEPDAEFCAVLRAHAGSQGFPVEVD